MLIRRASRTLGRELVALEASPSVASGPACPEYRDDPAGYTRDVLGVTLTPGQNRVVEALMAHRKVLVGAGHSVGKSVLGACLVNWWFDTRWPGVCMTTAPTRRQVEGILWQEVRTLRAKARRRLPDCWAGPRTPRLQSTPDHWAHGFTARDATRFQGYHSKGGVFVIFDEAEGVEPPFWQALRTMLDARSYFVALYNPTTPGSAAHQAEQQADDHGIFRRVPLSCLDHPNIVAEVAGEPVPIPGAITLQQLEEMLLEDSQVLAADEPRIETDVELNGKWYRPGPIASPRCLGRRPGEATVTLWGESLWKRVLATRHVVQPHWGVAIGCDVGRYGDDRTAFVVRKGYAVLRVEATAKLGTDSTARRLRELCEEFADADNQAKRIPCLIDEGGVGGGVIDQAGEYLFVPVNASCKARNPLRYNRVRAELWFVCRQAANEGLMDLSRVPPHLLKQLHQELSVVRYEVIPGTSKMDVSSKDDVKALIRRSPDLADAFNLAFYPPLALGA